jgi:hypothetical protein
MFVILGLLVALYVVQAMVTGEVYAKHRWWGRTIVRDEEPGEYWTTLVIYLGLAIAMMTVF